jgi:hypothetical protein
VQGQDEKAHIPSSFSFKGSGWYVTDYASKSGGYDGKTGSGEPASSEPAKEAKGSSADAAPKKAEAAKSAKAKDE